ncbi:MAG: phospholipase D family protein [Candidatus Hydrogenedentes bacterium]|nr:phospholipase D family protein [Candidatus Hydrogenedentota bacterium]
MLEPSDRSHLLNALKPPPGYELDSAVGTTYSLDLLTLVTVPLAFTMFAWEDTDGKPVADPLALLEALRRHAGRIVLFCQSGQISIPKSSQLLYSYIEDTVVEVSAPNPRGVFHPKIWVLRFVASGEPVLYRMLCSTRNLTFDHSWDTVLVLDGTLVDRKNAFSVNRPLADFVRALPQMALRPLESQAQARIDVIQDELRRVSFEVPAGFDDMTFWPLGVPNAKRWPFTGRMSRTVVVSPFVSAACLARVANGGNGNVLVSRLESLETLTPENLSGFERVYVLNPVANVEDTDTEDVENSPAIFNGLHAKLYVADDGWNARIWTGSANATDAAFDRNVEFLVELVGKKSVCGVDTFLKQEKGKTNIMDLLQEFVPDGEMKTQDIVQQRLEELLRRAVDGIVNKQLVAKVSTSTEGRYSVTLCGLTEPCPPLSEVASIRCWPVTLKESAAVGANPDVSEVAVFEALSFEALTSFFAFDIGAEIEGQKLSRRFVVNAPLDGAPRNRRERILRSLLRNRQELIRFLLFILSEEGVDMRAFLMDGNGRNASGQFVFGMGGSTSLFELLIKALYRNPEKLDRIDRLIQDLQESPESQDLLPEGFEAIWKPIWTARRGVRK